MQGKILFALGSAMAIALMLGISIALFFPWAVDPQQARYSDACLEKYGTVNGSNFTSPTGILACTFGPQDPPRLPNPQINITVKTIHFFWFGDCKVMASTGEVYRSDEDQICMAQPGENLTVYQYRTRDNTITDLIQMEA
ncbi:MAG: hypothetical protein WC998_09990 [Candidatus Paceibacterota bacterium]|jgi:hypothetical protein